MTFLIILVTAFVATWALPSRYGGRSLRTPMRRAMALSLIVAGVSHFAAPDSFRAYIPAWVPARDALVYVSGVLEVIGGLALLGRRELRGIGNAIALYLLLVFPANVYVAVADVEVSGPMVNGWYHWARLPLQALFIWWVLHSTSPAGPDRPRAVASHPARATG